MIADAINDDESFVTFMAIVSLLVGKLMNDDLVPVTGIVVVDVIAVAVALDDDVDWPVDDWTTLTTGVGQ